jgi:hypothetical protein
MANTNTTLEQMNVLAQKIADLRVEEERVSQTKKAITAELEAAENEMITLLVENQMKNYKAPCGLISLSHRTSVKTPKTPEDRAAFFEYLKQQGLYDSMISVNSLSLAALYKEEFKKAIDAGATDYEMPGIREVTINPSISFRRA